MKRPPRPPPVAEPTGGKIESDPDTLAAPPAPMVIVILVAVSDMSPLR